MKTCFALVGFSLVALAACSGAVVPLGEVDQGVTKSAPAGSVAAVPACAEPTGDTYEYTSIADAAAHLSGVWSLCSGAITAPADTAGIELAATQAKFLVEQDGYLLHASDPSYERSVEIVDTTTMNGPGAYQVNLSTSTSTNMYSSRTSTDGRFLELVEATSGKRSRYVRTEALSPSCGIVASAVHAFASVDDVRAKTGGKWALCSGKITAPEGSAGIELAGSKAYFLFGSAPGLTRKDGWDYERDVSVSDTTGTGVYQINLEDVGNAGFTNMYHARVSSSGDTLELAEATSGNVGVYKHLP